MTRDEILNSNFELNQIKDNVEDLYTQIANELVKGHFELNETIADCYDQINAFEEKCAEQGHTFVNGECIYCYAIENEIGSEE